MSTTLAGMAGRLSRRPAFRLLRRAAPLVGICAVTALAFHYSLGTLLTALGLDTPLAYVGLVPFLALAIAVPRWRAPRDEVEINDHQVDFIVGVPLLVASLVLPVMLDQRMQATFWTLRVDLLSLPLFVAGVLTLTYGVRTMWRVRLPLGFLLLSWPLPYTIFLEKTQDHITAATTFAVAHVIDPLNVARVIETQGDPLFQITGPQKETFLVSLASACSGLSGTVGFLLIGIGLACVSRGPRWAKTAWLSLGILVAWLLNVVRITTIIVAGHVAGQGLALDALHPVLGLILFGVAVVVMMVLMPAFGVSWAGGRAATSPAAADHERQIKPPARAWSNHTRVTAASAVALVAVVAVMSATFNSGLQGYSAIGGSLGGAKLQSLAAQPPQPAGWVANRIGTVPWATQYFGSHSVWNRMSYTISILPKASPVTGRASIVADVVTTPDAGRLNAYGVLACYRFHGFDIRQRRIVDVGHSLHAEVISFYNKRDHKAWTTLNWQWPVTKDNRTDYERVTLILLDDSGLSVPTVTETGNNTASGARSTTTPDRWLEQSGGLLVAIAKELVRLQIADAAHAKRVTA